MKVEEEYGGPVLMNNIGLYQLFIFVTSPVTHFIESKANHTTVLSYTRDSHHTFLSNMVSRGKVPRLISLKGPLETLLVLFVIKLPEPVLDKSCEYGKLLQYLGVGTINSQHTNAPQNLRTSLGR